MRRFHTKPFCERLENSLPWSGGYDSTASSVERGRGAEIIGIAAKDLAALDAAAEEELVAAPAVIGAGAIGRDGAPKLGDAEYGDVVPRALCNHLRLEGADGRIDLTEEERHVWAVIRVGIKRAVRHKEDLALRLQLTACANHLGHLLELLANPVAGVKGLVERHSVERVAKLVGACERGLRQAREGLAKDGRGGRREDLRKHWAEGGLC